LSLVEVLFFNQTGVCSSFSQPVQLPLSQCIPDQRNHSLVITPAEALPLNSAVANTDFPLDIFFYANPTCSGAVRRALFATLPQTCYADSREVGTGVLHCLHCCATFNSQTLSHFITHLFFF
jgi:hypothetical protein